MKKLKFIIMGALVALLAVAGVTFASSSASATEASQCVPSEAWTEVITPEIPATEGTPAVDAVYETVVVQEAGWQRYSYNGAWHSNTEAPPFPGDKWQANTASDPHGVGVEGAYFRSHGNSGNGDWFYLEATPEVTEQVLVSEAVPAIPGSPAVPAVTIEHEAVTCEEEPTVPATPENPSDDTLAMTGSDDVSGLIAGGLGSLLLGGLALAVRQRMLV